MRMENGPDDDLNDGEERRVGDDANDLITDICDIIVDFHFPQYKCRKT